MHVFWNSTGRLFGAKQAATIESFLLTQSSCLALWIWTEDDTKLRSDVAAFPALFASHQERIKIVRYRPHELAVGTPLEGRLDVLDGNDVTATKADILRALILNHYDGIYIDIDSLFLQASHVTNRLHAAFSRRTPASPNACPRTCAPCCPSNGRTNGSYSTRSTAPLCACSHAAKTSSLY